MSINLVMRYSETTQKVKKKVLNKRLYTKTFNTNEASDACIAQVRVHDLMPLYVWITWVGTDIGWQFHANSAVRNIFTEGNVDAFSAYFPCLTCAALMCLELAMWKPSCTSALAGSIIRWSPLPSSHLFIVGHILFSSTKCWTQLHFHPPLFSPCLLLLLIRSFSSRE